jgi:hypothetical protein
MVVPSLDSRCFLRIKRLQSSTIQAVPLDQLKLSGNTKELIISEKPLSKINLSSLIISLVDLIGYYLNLNLDVLEIHFVIDLCWIVMLEDEACEGL